MVCVDFFFTKENIGQVFYERPQGGCCAALVSFFRPRLKGVSVYYIHAMLYYRLCTRGKNMNFCVCSSDK